MSLPGCQGRIDDTDAQPKRYFSDRARAQRSRNRVWLSWSDRDQAAAGMTPPA